MKTYEVRVTRIGYGHARFEVQAPNQREARRAALEAAGNYSAWRKAIKALNRWRNNVED